MMASSLIAIMQRLTKEYGDREVAFGHDCREDTYPTEVNPFTGDIGSRDADRSDVFVIE